MSGLNRGLLKSLVTVAVWFLLYSFFLFSFYLLVTSTVMEKLIEKFWAISQLLLNFLQIGAHVLMSFYNCIIIGC